MVRLPLLSSWAVRKHKMEVPYSFFNVECFFPSTPLLPLSNPPLPLLQVKSTSSTRGQSPPRAWSCMCARARRRRTRRRGQSSRSSRPDVPTDPPKSSTREASPARHLARPPDRPLKSVTHLPSLSRLCTHRERRCPSFQFNYKQKQTNKHCSKTVFVGSVAME